MDNNIVFSETQRFRQWWFWLILVAFNGFTLTGIFFQVFLEKPLGNHLVSVSGVWISVGVSLLLTVLFLSCKLETQVREAGICVRFFPVQITFRCYTWNMLNKIYVRKYAPIAEYGGWGWRIGFMGRGAALNVSGNKGLQLEFDTGRKLLIGTQKEEELTRVLEQLGQLKK